MEGQADDPAVGTVSTDGKSERRCSNDEVDHEAASRRYRTLVRLEEVLRLLVDRHGARMSLGEILAVTASMARLCRQDQVSIAEIAEATGLPKQNLSRWARKRVGDSIALRVNEDDQRRQDLIMLDRGRGQESLDRIAQVLRTDIPD